MRGIIAASLALITVQTGMVGLAFAEESEASLQFKRDQHVIAPKGEKSEAPYTVQAIGLMGQLTDGRFHPEKSVTRAELATIITRTFKLEERHPVAPEPVSFKDVSSQHRAADAIRLVVSRGIMQGYHEGYFNPEQRVSRAEALAIFAQAYGVYQYDDSIVSAILSNYPDAYQIPAWAKKAVATSLKYGFVDVTPPGKIYPLQPMTRGDMAYVLTQYLDRLHQSEQKTLQ